MKCTGIVRRIDELGRVVIPKEIRKVMKIKEGEPLEIFLDNGSVVLKKYRQDVADAWHDACAKYIEQVHERPQMQDIRYMYSNYITTCVGYAPNAWGKLKKHVGTARLNVDEDRYDPIIGQAIAHCRAVHGQDCDYMSIIGLED